MIFCGSWFCVEKKEKTKAHPNANFVPIFKWSEQPCKKMTYIREIISIETVGLCESKHLNGKIIPLWENSTKYFMMPLNHGETQRLSQRSWCFNSADLCSKKKQTKPKTTNSTAENKLRHLKEIFTMYRRQTLLWNFWLIWKTNRANRNKYLRWLVSSACYCISPPVIDSASR